MWWVKRSRQYNWLISCFSWYFYLFFGSEILLVMWDTICVSAKVQKRAWHRYRFNAQPIDPAKKIWFAVMSQPSSAETAAAPTLSDWHVINCPPNYHIPYFLPCDFILLVLVHIFDLLYSYHLSQSFRENKLTLHLLHLLLYSQVPSFVKIKNLMFQCIPSTFVGSRLAFQHSHNLCI